MSHSGRCTHGLQKPHAISSCLDRVPRFFQPDLEFDIAISPILCVLNSRLLLLDFAHAVVKRDTQQRLLISFVTDVVDHGRDDYEPLPDLLDAQWVVVVARSCAWVADSEPHAMHFPVSSGRRKTDDEAQRTQGVAKQRSES